MYTFSQLRVHLKEALDKSEISPVKVLRRKRVFYIISEKDYKKMVVEAVRQQLKRESLEDTPAKSSGGIWDVGQPTRKQIDSKPPDPAPEPENVTSQNLVEGQGMPCCEKTKRCKHWEHQPLDSVWENQLTGETREII